MVEGASWLESLEPCLRKIGEAGRVFPNGRRIEVVFIIKAANLLLLRTEGPGDINEATLPESGISVPVIQPQKLMAVTRRRLLQLLRMYRDSGADLKQYIEVAKELGFKKAEEHLTNDWNCTIQPPLAEGGGGATDIGMDGYCPACTIFGAALTEYQYEKAGGTMSVGVKTRVHFDPAFATAKNVQPETHNKVTEGEISTTGGALYNEIHVMPGTVFVGRAVLHDVTEPELLTVLYSLATLEEIGGRSGVYGTIEVELKGIRCGNYSITTALDLADEIASAGKEKPSEIGKMLEEKLKTLGMKAIINDEVTNRVDPSDKDGTFKLLWESSIDFVKQLDAFIVALNPPRKKRSRK